MKRKLFVFIFMMFMFVGVVSAAEIEKNVLIGKGETFTLNPNADAGTTGKTYTFEAENNGCFSVTTAGVVTGTRPPKESTTDISTCEVSYVVATPQGGGDVVKYTIGVVEKIDVAKNGGTITCTGTETDGRTFVAGGGRYEIGEEYVTFRAEPTYGLRDIFPTTNAGAPEFKCTLTKSGTNFAGWYTDGEESKLVEDSLMFAEYTNRNVHPTWSDTTASVESIEIQDPDKAGILVLTVDEAHKTLKAGIFVHPYYAANKEATWTSLNPEIVTASADGTLTAVAAGDAVVKATSVDGNKEATIKVKVLPAGEMSYHVLLPETPTISIGESVVFQYYQLGYGPMVDGMPSYESSDPSVAEVEMKDGAHFTGKVTGKKEGTATITGRLGENLVTTTTITVVKGQHEAGDYKFLIKYEGGEGVNEGFMENTPVYDGEKATLAKNSFKRDKYVFAGWKVYLEDAQGGRVEVKIDGEPLTFKDGQDLPKINVPDGSNLVLVAQWATNPDTGAIIPITIGVLAVLALYLYFIQSKKFNKISNI